MSDLSRQQRIAIDAVARQFSATWEESDRPQSAYIAVNGRRVAVDLAMLKQRRPDRDDSTKAGLRFDRVATGLIRRVQAAFSAMAPPGVAAALTVTAPILLPAKTAATLKEKIEILLGRPTSKRDEKDTVHGNGIQIRLLRNKREQAPKLVGFVHNPETDPLLLLNMAQEWIEFIGGVVEGPAEFRAEDRWLVAITSRTRSCLAVYRSIAAQMRMANSYGKILLMFADGSIESLAE